ncbi:unnamed protein product [Pleuronectes platessa]|uniref:Uncharacterized protein n=1 Tax=Pleuronectes platessa TaxID=8262 RepID=A0A9N7TRN8_PLEPL|nr:unnamed protein product [Pleuronectes platessa]
MWLTSKWPLANMDMDRLSVPSKCSPASTQTQKWGTSTNRIIINHHSDTCVMRRYPRGYTQGTVPLLLMGNSYSRESRWQGDPRHVRECTQMVHGAVRLIARREPHGPVCETALQRASPSSP